MSTKEASGSIKIDDNDDISYEDEEAMEVYTIAVSKHDDDTSDVFTIADDQQSDPLQFQCDICDSCFDTKEERNVHIEDHFKNYKCPSCTRLFVGDRAFEYHTRNGKCKIIVTQTLFRCNLCNEKVFKSASALKVHENTVHGCVIEQDCIRCQQCQRTFAQLRYLRKHIYEVHRKSTQFNCSVCRKVFNRRSNLTEHMLIHEQKYLAPCDICKKSFRTKSALRLHKRMHTGEKPYKCDICMEKAFAYNTDLKRHKRQAHGIVGTPHPCLICDQVFYEPKLLRRHTTRCHPVKSDPEAPSE